jgi:hypothetical protein
MCITITEADIITEEDIIAYKVVSIDKGSIDRRYYSEFRPESRRSYISNVDSKGYINWEAMNLGSFEEYQIGTTKTDEIGHGYYLYTNKEDALDRCTYWGLIYAVLEVNIPKNTAISRGKSLVVNKPSIIAKTINILSLVPS